MKLFSLLFDSPIYAEICNYLEIKDIKNIYISNKKIYENINNKKYTKNSMIFSYFTNFNKKYSTNFDIKYSTDEELIETLAKWKIIEKKLAIHQKILKIK